MLASKRKGQDGGADVVHGPTYDPKKVKHVTFEVAVADDDTGPGSADDGPNKIIKGGEVVKYNNDDSSFEFELESNEIKRFLINPGHTLCSICRNKLTKCPTTCQSRISSNRNYPIEKIVIDSIIVQCDFCHFEVRLVDISNHSKICKFRPVQCSYDLCQDQDRLINFRDFPRHLINLHGFSESFAPTWKTYWNISRQPAGAARRIFKMDQNDFLVHFSSDSDSIYLWAYFIGDETQIDKYKISFTIFKDSLTKTKYNLPNCSVYSIRNSFEAIKPKLPSIKLSMWTNEFDSNQNKIFSIDIELKSQT